MNLQANVNKALSPMSSFINKNNKVINLLLITLVVLVIFPVEYFVDSNPVEEMQTTLSVLISSPMGLVVTCILTYVIFSSNNVVTFTLYMFLLHKLLDLEDTLALPTPTVVDEEEEEEEDEEEEEEEE